MSKLSTAPYRGTRDFYPEDQWLMNYIFSVWREVCAKFGYEEYNTPTIEPIDLYAAKTSEEIVQKQTYSFEDRGGRNVTIRPEMTPSVARLVASRRQEWGYPLRLFSVPNCMRYERPQKGRLREFWQLNADIFGLEGVEADMEMIMLADAILKAFGADESMYEIRINSRQLLKQKIEKAGIKTTSNDANQVIDAREKMADDDFKRSLSEHIEDVDALIESLESTETTEDLDMLLDMCKAKSAPVIYDPSLARGFDYYTDIVFEVFDKDPENNRSMFGGGRYDNLVGIFGVESVATVGFGMGDATLIEFLKSHNLLPDYNPICSTVALPLSDRLSDVEQVVASLRHAGVALAVDYSGRKTDKAIKSALKQRRNWVLFIGDDELESQRYSLKNLETGEQEQLTEAEIVKRLT